MTQEPIDRAEVEALLSARQELGPHMQPALVDSFAHKIMHEVQRQSEMERQRMVQERPPAAPAKTGEQLALGIVSLVMSIPLTAIAFGYSAPWMVVVIWASIVLINYAFVIARRPSP